MIVAENTPTLDEVLADWLDLIDQLLAASDVALPERPLQAVLRLLSLEALTVNIGDEPVKFAGFADHAAEPWFRILYIHVERWYQKTYGEEAVRGRGVRPLQAVVLIRGVPYALVIPAIRNVVHKEHVEAWMYFEEGLGDDECALQWVQHAPEPEALGAQRRAELEENANRISRAMRRVYFRRMGVPATPEAEGLAEAARGYLESAAIRLRSAKAQELGPAFFDLQMAAESAVKLVLQINTGGYPHSHLLADLLKSSAKFGVVFDVDRLAGWPAFATMSDYRYSQGDTGGIEHVFSAYLLILDLVAAAMSVIKSPLGSGSGFLLRRPPWLTDERDSGETPAK